MPTNDPDLKRLTEELAVSILSYGLDGGDSIEAVADELQEEGSDFTLGFLAALDWMEMSIIPVLMTRDITKNKTERTGAMKLGLVFEEIAVQAQLALGQLLPPEDSLIIVGDVEPASVEEDEETGLKTERHIFAYSKGRITIEVRTTDTLAVVLAADIVSAFNEDSDEANAFASWMCLISLNYENQGKKVIFVNSPVVRDTTIKPNEP